MELKHYLISILVFGLVVTAFWYSFVDLGDTYGVTLSSEYSNIYSNISSTMNSTRENVRDIRTDVEGTEAAPNSEDQYGGSLIKGAFNSLRLIWNSWAGVNLIINQVSAKLGIPSYMFLTFGAIIIILIVFAIVSAVFKHPL